MSVTRTEAVILGGRHQSASPNLTPVHLPYPSLRPWPEALCNYHTVRATSTGLAVDEPIHDWASHASDALRTIAEADMTGMLHSAGSTANYHRRPVTIRTGFRGNAWDDPESSILDRFFGKPRPNVRVIR
jgi:hypothetical protein